MHAGGFSLIELMIAMLISLILIGGAVSVFLSNQQTYRMTQDLDQAQEAFRFTSQTILRVMRQGTALDTSDGATLRVRIESEPGAGLRDCLGRSVAEPAVVNEFRLVGNSLVCSVQGESPASEVLATDIAKLSFRYSDESTQYWALDTAHWMASTTGESRSVAVRLQMETSGLETEFVATLRNAMIRGSTDAGDTP